jgi:preprotein translocase subunit SecF
MTRVINFDRSFKYTVPISLVIILSGLVGVAVLGFNNGVDFQAGLNTDVQFAPPSIGLSFTGQGTMSLTVGKNEVDLLAKAPSGESKSYAFPFEKYKTMGAMVDGLKSVPGVDADLRVDGALDSALIVGSSSQTSAVLSSTPMMLHFASKDASQLPVSVEEIRAALKDFGNISIQRVGDAANREFMVRIEDSGKDPTFASTVHLRLAEKLGTSFGADNVMVNSSSFVGARFSQNLANQAIWLTILTFAVILIYCSIRFKPNYAIGAVLSVIHDALVMVAFIVFTRMEFSTTIIAAILTIVGYSINDTIVIYDRIREKVRLSPTAVFRENMNRGVTETLGRTFITSATVLLTAIALFVFTTGSMKDFALCIIVGVVTGTYSSVFIASAFVDGWNVLEVRAQKKRLARSAIAKPVAAERKVQMPNPNAKKA